MKKLLLLFFIALVFNVSVFADMTLKEEQQVEALLSKAQKTMSVDDFNDAMSYYIKLAKKYKEPINAGALDSAVALNVDRYNTVHQVKYKNNAEYYAKLAILNGTENLSTIIAGITLAGEDLDTREMIKFYDYMCKINNEACIAIKDVFSEQVALINQQVATNKANASARRWNTFNTILYTYLQNRPSYSHTTGTVDCNGFVNLDTVSY